MALENHREEFAQAPTSAETFTQEEQELLAELQKHSSELAALRLESESDQFGKDSHIPYILQIMGKLFSQTQLKLLLNTDLLRRATQTKEGLIDEAHKEALVSNKEYDRLSDDVEAKEYQLGFVSYANAQAIANRLNEAEAKLKEFKKNLN